MIKKLVGLKKKVMKTVKAVRKDESGMEMIQVIIICLIAIILGGILLGIFSDAFNEIGPLMVSKIKSVFSL
ncbi:hypothetical protein Ami103574_10790 [Aminipila butyrica]|uniref:Uncharacterized protein n=1 Tax=Aminipila butyrica TaxID=433296 RepID=A0A858C083_9FIRM|nr:hypothetical protein [Aminipila butyrica]QIB69776.1 hypothetical protein Ami103574_10790 [Aminipila butyrica]